MDRASGGDGQGNLGILKIIGDVYYVTTDEDSSFYNNDYQLINSHVLTKLKNQQQVDYRNYDNWRFMKNGQYYNHEYLPGVGDGNIDFVMFFYRNESGNISGSKSYEIPSNFILDGKRFNGYGSKQYGYRKVGDKPSTITVPIHEFTHYLFSGNNITGHLDGREVYGNQINIGNVSFFALMLSTAGENSFYSAYERYRAGWLNPTVLNTSQSSIFLQDTHKKHKAFLIPVRQDANNPSITAEYYIIENFQNTNSYAGANPFLTKYVFNHTFDHGLLVFHIEQEDYNIPTNSNLDIECADGLWNFYLSEGANTPYDRTDDVLAKFSTSRIHGFDERDRIVLTVGPVTYNDYYCLTPASCGAHCPPNHGRRYHKDSRLGDRDDFFRFDGTRVFSSWSNPQLCLASGTTVYKGIEVKNYYPNIREYELSYQSGYNDVLSLSPSKPQNIRIVATQDLHPNIIWENNLEPDIYQYRVLRSTFSNHSYTQIAVVNHNPFISHQNYIDYTVSLPPPGGVPGVVYYYKIVARDNSLLESVPSDYASVTSSHYWWEKMSPGEDNNHKIVEYNLNDNFPNPFNPTTTINYSVKQDALVTLKVYDILGSEVASLVSEMKAPGHYSVNFNASSVSGGLSSGVYIYRLTATSNDRILFTDTKRMLLMK